MSPLYPETNALAAEHRKLDNGERYMYVHYILLKRK
jgi:hypothetical protein